MQEQQNQNQRTVKPQVVEWGCGCKFYYENRREVKAEKCKECKAKEAQKLAVR